jgi:hypothetical protein
MAPHAVAVDARHVRAVIEPEVVAGEISPFAHERLAVAAVAVVRVVRLGMAADARRRRGEVDGRFAPRRPDAGVALDAADPVVHVRAVLERV